MIALREADIAKLVVFDEPSAAVTTHFDAGMSGIQDLIAANRDIIDTVIELYVDIGVIRGIAQGSGAQDCQILQRHIS